MIARHTYLICGYISFALGVIGIFLPILPTVPFMLLASFFFSKGSERVHQWLLNHRYFGRGIREWEENGVISKKAKILATLSIAILGSYPLILFPIKPALRIVAAVVMLSVLAFVWSRPSEARKNSGS